VVTQNVPPYALMMGVPAKRTGWISAYGATLPKPDKNKIMICPESKVRYKEIGPNKIKCLDSIKKTPGKRA